LARFFTLDHKDVWTQNQLNLPVNRPVIVHLSSKDVIHRL
jgi:heme/copper-type cytochrome/quinol oxidase subunit 2